MPEEIKKLSGLCVEVLKGGDKTQSLENAIKKLKRMIKESDLMVDFQENLYYKKPSEIKREKKNKAKARSRYNKIHGEHQ